MPIALEMVISGFVSKVVNDCSDILKKRIKDADKNRKSGVQNIETRIYQVTIDALNEFTKDTYIEQDALYDTAENILKGFKSCKDDNTEAVKTGLKMLVSQVTSDTCKVFLETLCHKICTDENDILYKEIVLIQQEKTNENLTEGFRDNKRNHEKTQEKLNKIIDGLKERSNTKGNHESENSGKIPIKNRAEEYADKWDKNVFLNNFNKRDKNAGVNIKLKDIYLEKHLPHYVWEKGDEPLVDLNDLLSEYIVDNDGRKMLLILGQAGIGKSTLITWIMANLVEKEDNIYVYQFASDLKNINWQNGNILNEILNILNLEYKELENKSLILDGFDEIYAAGDREGILNRLNQELVEMNVLKNFSMIITCRENYVYRLDKIECDFITLQTWDDDQIKSFCAIYGEKSTSTVSETIIDRLLENKEVFGIPLILYMVLALNIAIEENASLIGIYDQIFSLDRSSIYDRCIENSRYGKAHRISEYRIKQQIHQISQRIAFWIFENNPEKAFISQEKFEEICENEMDELGERGEEIQRDTLIGNFFKLNHCEGKGTDEIQFVHRSIYEYFVAVYFFESIYKLKSKEEVAGKLGELLKDGHLSKQILDFIKYKFESMKECNFPDSIKEIFQMMLQDGMTYHTKDKYKNIIDREMNIFYNMLDVVHLWNSELGEFDEKIVSYLHYNRRDKLNLKGIELRDLSLTNVYLGGANLNGAKLKGALLIFVNLRGADLSGVDLSRARVVGTSLIKADLSRADLNHAALIRTRLVEAKLNGADLNGANLSGSDLSEVSLNESNLNGMTLCQDQLYTIVDEKEVDLLNRNFDLSDCMVYISETTETVSYKDYCIRKQR